MPSNDILTYAKFIAVLDDQRRTFTSQHRPLTGLQRAKLGKWNQLMGKDVVSLNQHQRKARRISSDIKEQIGDEVYLLCTLATTPSGLAFSKLENFLVDAAAWWAGVEHPLGLTLVVKKGDIFGAFTDNNRVIDSVPGQPPGKYDCTFESSSSSNTQVCLGMTSSVSALKQHANKTLESSPLSLDRPAYQPKLSVQTHTLTDMLDFLRQYEGNCPMLQMVCPWDGDPLPSISANLGPKLSFKIEFSVQASESFLKYVSSRTTVAEVS